MVRKFGPFDTSQFYEVENRRLQRAFNPGTGFVKAGQGAVTAGTGAQLVIGAYPDGALVDGLYVENPATETVTLTTNSGNTNPRIDRLVMRLDMTAKTIAPYQIVGTPAASPSAPPLVRTATVVDMPLCRYTMPGSASAQNPASITDEHILRGGSLQTVNWAPTQLAGSNGITTPVITADQAGTPYRLRVASSLQPTLVGTGIPILQLWIEGQIRDQFHIHGVTTENDLFPSKVSRTLDVADGRAVQVYARLNIPAGVTATTYLDDSHSWLTVEAVPL